MDEVIKIDSYEPNYKRYCCNCGAKPTVNGVKNGKVIYRGEMCGPCTWGDSDLDDPKEWNK